jgi:hypothetical protein
MKQGRRWVTKPLLRRSRAASSPDNPNALSGFESSLPEVTATNQATESAPWAKGDPKEKYCFKKMLSF